MFSPSILPLALSRSAILRRRLGELCDNVARLSGNIAPWILSANPKRWFDFENAPDRPVGQRFIGQSNSCGQIGQLLNCVPGCRINQIEVSALLEERPRVVKNNLSNQAFWMTSPAHFQYQIGDCRWLGRPPVTG